MNYEQLKRARLERGWSQQQAAARLDVTQPYLSMLESGRRSPAPLARRLMQVYGLPPTVLPVHEIRENVTADFLAHELASLGYPGFVHLRGRTRRTNPAEFLLTALAQRNLEARVRGVHVADISRDYLRAAAQLRAATGVKTPDSLQVVAALAVGCTAFLTNDRDLPPIPGLRILQLSSYVR
jgi:transcriptional regulator with XRE-family HTH domain